MNDASASSNRDSSHASGPVIDLLTSIASGDRRAAADLLPLVYDELRRLARARMAQLAPGNTIQPTALVHEAYLQLVGDADPGWNGRGHFFGAAAQAMREILVDTARRRRALKRGGDREQMPLDDALVSAVTLDIDSEDLIALDLALDDFQAQHPRAAQIVMLRQFAGLATSTIAEVLDVTTRTVERDWRFARAWLKKAVGDGTPE